jgi:Conserved hypothetical protein 95
VCVVQQKEDKSDANRTSEPSIRTRHLRLPFIHDIYWTTFGSLVLGIPVQVYHSLKSEGMRRKSVSKVKVFQFELELLRPYAAVIRDEMPMWEKYYLPVPVKDKTVLDVGAGCGETAAFYLAHGARKVIAIEPDDMAYSILLRNVRANGMNVVAIRKPFELIDLQIPHDLFKIDAEGAEVALLEYSGSLGSCIIEAHTVGMQRTHLGALLAKKFGLRILCKPGDGESIWLLSSGGDA